eukprot:2324449-Rhodomonas_salina.3
MPVTSVRSSQHLCNGRQLLPTCPRLILSLSLSVCTGKVTWRAGWHFAGGSCRELAVHKLHYSTHPGSFEATDAGRKRC